MDMCTGSGCLAILMAFAFPNAEIVAVDISQDALDVAAANIAAYGLEDRIRLVKSDGFAQVPEQRFDFILSNPPYVTREAMDALPAEYLHEPGLALGSGEDGLDLVRKLLADAPATCPRRPAGDRSRAQPGDRRRGLPGPLAYMVVGPQRRRQDICPRSRSIVVKRGPGEDSVILTGIRWCL
jgi:SAM-dependent methyltransferase